MQKADVIAKTVAGLGYELLGARRDRAGVIHLTIDAGEGSAAGIGSADCARVGEHLSYLLPVEGVAYRRLEVSSPGPRRPLTKPAHFARFRGSACKLRLKQPREGRGNFTGTIAAVASSYLQLSVDGATENFDFDEIAAASLCAPPTRPPQSKRR